ncbi:tyrosine-type recombinase/integrase [Nitrolancea hollandica]|uniref:Integrase family protein n=1 Tax=Nitrolancea hollandica Lb TaxID=1129897 RepID=I4EHH7_9BACT|nr:site-specific integrase [Nitrolancea hollandica]CCF84139.1 Integrase family protein [Nitrolancea hollandica Lb]
MASRRGHGEGSIYQRESDGLWVASVNLGYVDGKRRRKSLYGKTRREVAEKIKAVLRDQQQGLPVTIERLTLGQYLERWLSASVKPSVKPKTYETYESIVRVRVIPHLGKRRLAKVTPLDLQSLYSDLQESGLSARSIGHTHRALHRAFVQAVRWDLIPRNPCDGVTPPRPNRAELHVLTQDQVNTLIEATTDPQRRTLYTLAVTTGMRAGELYGLRWGDIDLSAGRLSVRRALQRQRDKGLVFVTPKTARSRRTIILSKWAVSMLREHRTRQLEQRLAAGPLWQDGDVVFCRAAGNPLDPSTETGTFSETLKRAGLPHIRFHDLRHTAATLLLAQGTHPKVVSEMLGHSSIALTLDTYSHLVPALHEQAAATMDSLFGAAM